MEYQDRIFHSMVMQRRPGKVPGQGRFTTILVVRTNAGVYFATLNAYATRFTMNFQIIARYGVLLRVFKLFEPRGSGNPHGHVHAHRVPGAGWHGEEHHVKDQQRVSLVRGGLRHS